MRMKSLDYYNYISHNDNRQTCVTLEIVNIIDCIKFFQVIIIIHKGSPFQLVTTSIWALPVWGGGLNPCPDGLGHFFREEFSKFKWAFA